MAHCSNLTAPAQCFFDVTALTSTATKLPYQEVVCAWNFGDSGAGNWSYGVPSLSSRNTSAGQIAAHVYETSGTFTPSVMCNDGSSIQTLTLPSIAVASADTTWPTTNTVCFYNSSLGSGCPSGADTYSTSSFPAAMSYATSSGAHAPYHRILFKGGDTFTYNSYGGGQIVSYNGPGLISSYGTGKANVTATVIPIYAALVVSANDWRVTNLSFHGAGGNPNDTMVVRFTEGVAYGTVDGLDFTNYPAVLDFETCCSGGGVNNFVAINSTVSNLTGDGSGSSWGFFGGTTSGQKYLAIMGNSFVVGSNTALRNANILRLQPTCRWCVISNNLIDNSQISYTAGKFDAQAYRSEGDISKYIEFYANRVPGDTGTYFAAQDVNTDERLQNIIVENNWFGQSGNGDSAQLKSEASNITVRDNIFDARNTGGGAGAIVMGTTNVSGYPVPNNVQIYNNTFYYAGTAASPGWAWFMQPCNMSSNRTIGSYYVKNNVIYSPNESSTTLFDIDTGSRCTGGTITASNNTASSNSGANQIGTGPTQSPAWVNASGNYSSASDFRPSAGSYSIGAGAGVPVWADFFNVEQPLPKDIGAVRH